MSIKDNPQCCYWSWLKQDKPARSMPEKYGIILCCYKHSSKVNSPDWYHFEGDKKQLTVDKNHFQAACWCYISPKHMKTSQDKVHHSCVKQESSEVFFLYVVDKFSWSTIGSDLDWSTDQLIGQSHLVNNWFHASILTDQLWDLLIIAVHNDITLISITDISKAYTSASPSQNDSIFTFYWCLIY